MGKLKPSHPILISTLSSALLKEYSSTTSELHTQLTPWMTSVKIANLNWKFGRNCIFPYLVMVYPFFTTSKLFFRSGSLRLSVLAGGIRP